MIFLFTWAVRFSVFVKGETIMTDERFREVGNLIKKNEISTRLLMQFLKAQEHLARQGVSLEEFVEFSIRFKKSFDEGMRMMELNRYM